MVLASLLVTASPGAPAAADTLKFGMFSDFPGFPPPPYGALTPIDMAVNGDTIYATTGDATYKLLKSVDAGATFADLSQTTDFPSANIDLVAVAPDDPNVVVIVTDTEIPYYSSDGGESWVTLANPRTDGAAVVNDIAVSGLTGGYIYVAAGGTDGTDAELYTMKLAMAQGWTPQYGKGNASGNSSPAQDAIQTIELSPNFQIDKIIGAISYDTGNNVYFQCFRYEEGAETWNGAIAYFESWRTAADEDGILLDSSITGALNTSALAFYSGYDGTDSGERIAFAGWADSAATPVGGVRRITDSYDKEVTTWSAQPLSEAHSLAFHEAGKLLIGSYNNNQVYACLTPMATDRKSVV